MSRTRRAASGEPHLVSGAERDGRAATQWEITRIALDALAGTGFALAGAGAIREHGITDRPTEDVDLFTSVVDEEAFAAAVDRVIEAVAEAGFSVTTEESRRTARFARLSVRRGMRHPVEVDLAVDWRAADPVTLDVGAVLDIRDAVHNKVSALYGRGAARDFLDVDAIRRSGRFTDRELVEAAAERDPGFDLRLFAEQLALARRLRSEIVAEYGVTESELQALVLRFEAWSDQLRGEPGGR